MNIRLGGPDNASINFLAGLPNGLYISPLIDDNSDPKIHAFLRERYFADGAALFGRESPEEMEDFRQVANIAANDTQTAEIIQYYVQRARNYAHLTTLILAEIDFARVDGDACDCGNEGRIVRVWRSAKRLKWTQRLPHWVYSRLVFGRDIGLPPFSLTCRCRMEGLIAGIDSDEIMRYKKCGEFGGLMYYKNSSCES